MSTEWSKTTRYFVFTLILIGFIWFINAARALVGALAISALLAYVINPVVTLANKRARMNRGLVVFLVYLLSLSALVILGIIFIPVIPEQTSTFLAELQTITDQIQEDYFSQTITVLNTEIDMSALWPDTAVFVDNVISPDIILSSFSAITTNIGWIAVVLVTTYYLLQDWDKLRRWLFNWAPGPYQEDLEQLYQEISLVWNRYFKGQLRLSLIVGLLTGLGCFAVGLNGALVFGILAAVFDVLLSVGPLIITGIAVLVALFAGSTLFPEMSNLIFALLVLGIFTAIQVAENVWLRPRIMSSSLRIHPAIVFIAIIASLALAGVLTALIIIPVIGSVAVISRYVYFKLFKMDPWAANPWETVIMTEDTAAAVVGHSAIMAAENEGDGRATPEQEQTRP